jgi:hypothetical protein
MENRKRSGEELEKRGMRRMRCGDARRAREEEETDKGDMENRRRSGAVGEERDEKGCGVAT